MAPHRPRHRNPRQLVVVAVMHVLRGLGALVFVGFLLATVMTKQPAFLVGAAISFLTVAIAACIHLAEAKKTCCPVCRTAIFARTGCNKHRNARRLFGSYRLQAAAQILTGSVFQCHHCGEGITCRTQAGLEPTPASEKPRRRVAKPLPRVPIEQFPDRNLPLPSSHTPGRMPASKEEPTLRS